MVPAMIRVIYGEKGMGKTKILVDIANNMALEGKGDVVFIDDSNQLMYDLKSSIRFINVSDFPITGQTGLLGFLCGIVSQNYDIEGIFIDGLNYIVKQKAAELNALFDNLKAVSEKYRIDFYITMNVKTDEVPEFLKEFAEKLN